MVLWGDPSALELSGKDRVIDPATGREMFAHRLLEKRLADSYGATDREQQRRIPLAEAESFGRGKRGGKKQKTVIPDLDMDAVIADAKMRDMTQRSNWDNALATFKKYVVVEEQRSKMDPSARKKTILIATHRPVPTEAIGYIRRHLALWMWKEKGFDTRKVEDYLSRIGYNTLGLKVGAPRSPASRPSPRPGSDP